MAVLLLPGNAQPSDVLLNKKFSAGQNYNADGTMTNHGIVTITPSTVDQAISEYYAPMSKVLGDADLISANVKATKNIFGVPGDPNVVDTSPGTALATDILAGKIAFVDGAQLIGTMVDRGTVNITPSTVNQTILGGYHSGAGVVYGDADLVAANIIAGKNIFGIAGSAQLRKFANGYVTDSSGNGSGLYVVTGLTFRPLMIIMSTASPDAYKAIFYCNASLVGNNIERRGYAKATNIVEPAVVTTTDTGFTIDVGGTYPPEYAYWAAFG